MNDLSHMYRRSANAAQASADRWKEMAIKFKRAGDKTRAITAFRQYRRAMRDVKEYREKANAYLPNSR